MKSRSNVNGIKFPEIIGIGLGLGWAGERKEVCTYRRRITSINTLFSEFDETFPIISVFHSKAFRSINY